MADYIAHARSNYFKVSRPAAFLNWVNSFPNIVFQPKAGYEESFDMIGMIYDEEGIGWPNWRFSHDPESGEDEVEIDFFAELAEFLAPNQVAILMEVGQEKLRYVGGMAVAVHSSGEIIYLSLNDIYERAQEAWPDTEEISDCSY